MRRALGPMLVACALAASVTVAPAGASHNPRHVDDGGGGGGAALLEGDRTKPVVYVHGYDAFGTIGYDCTSYFGDTYTALEGWGHTGTRALVRYYESDTKCSHDAHSHGSHSAHHASGHSAKGHTRDTKIRHLGYHLAWTIYDTFTSKGITVHVVGHSMGGLISRYAVAGVVLGDPDFPPSLLVEDVVTVGTPHDGSGDAILCSNAQCIDMRPGSEFLTWLETNAPNPGAPDTDWTTIGSESDSTVSADSAVHMAAPHKVKYRSSENLSHSGMLSDIEQLRDRDADVMHDNDGVWRFDADHARAVLRIDDAFVSSSH